MAFCMSTTISLRFAGSVSPSAPLKSASNSELFQRDQFQLPIWLGVNHCKTKLGSCLALKRAM